ncbi:hypothetical protein [Marinomonas gallaica]|uniref:hypothetical protein n=1 Tax=Marinomonas gallaica TaxID=1806667 RepID=UPI003A92FBA5
MNISYTTPRGKYQGLIQRPHLHQNGKYVVSKTRFKEDYIYVDSINDVKKYLDLGYKVRVSSLDPKTAPSLVKLSSLRID